MMSVSTFAWFAIGNPNVLGFDNTVIKFPNGVFVGFVGNDEDLENGKISFDNVLPKSSIKFNVVIKKPINTELKFSLKIKEMVPPNDSNGYPMYDIFDVFILKHNIGGVDFSKSMNKINAEYSGYFLREYAMESTETEHIFNFEIYFSDVETDSNGLIDINKFQGLEMTIGVLEMEIIY